MKPTRARRSVAVLTVMTLLLILPTFSMSQTTVAAPPFPIEPRAANLQIATGGYHTCGIHFDDLVRCWGDNTFGQTYVPEDLGTISAISAGDAHTCAIKSDNTIRCWGWDNFGQTTVPEDLGTVSSISAGYYFTCAIKTDNTLRCWGDNEYGQSDVPADLETVSAVSAGGYHTCAIKTDQTLRCWGSNTTGQITIPEDLGTVTIVDTGEASTCAIKTDNTLRCWGYNEDGQSDVPADLGTVSVVSSGAIHICAIKTDDTVRCWGDNTYGQTEVPADLGTVSTLNTGGYHTCVIKTDQTLRCWGYNEYWQNMPAPALVTLGVTGSPLAEGGGVSDITVTLSDYAWTNVHVNLAYSGTAIGGVDYDASASLVSFTTADLLKSVSLTGIDDAEIEGDETVMVDIDMVTGGTEDGAQQVTITIQDDDQVMETELVANGGFETDLTPWVVKKGTSDKVKCDQPGKVIAHSGACAFVFKGGTGENSSLQQILDLTGVTFAAGDTLDLSLYVNAAKAAASGKVKVVIQYGDETQDKLSLDLAGTAGYTLLNDSYTLLNASVNKLKLLIKHTSPSGKVYLDDLSLTHSAGSSSLMPLP